MGDPAYEHTVARINEQDPEVNLVNQVKIKEDVRIAGIVNLINHDVEIVPRKAYYRDARMQIVRNPTFTGIKI